jgi:hypothetical protein
MKQNAFSVAVKALIISNGKPSRHQGPMIKHLDDDFAFIDT